MIWSIDGRNYEMIMANGPASDFFRKKAGEAEGNFLELLDRSEMDIWSEYIARGLETGKYRTEYYDETMKKYYSLEVSRISVDQQNYDVAFFAKDITEEVELNEQIREINNRLEDKVREKTQDLEAAYQELNQYTHQIAHEIKAPLRAIELYNETIQDSLCEGKTEEATEASGQIGRFCRKSLKLLSETLNFSGLKAHTMKYEQIDMNELTEECLAELKNIYKEQPAECRVSPLPSVEGDRRLLKSCVFNILSNSFKYSSKKERTEIEVSCQRCGGQYVFVFTDHGAGFDMDYAQNLFEMFARMHTDGEFEGTGIGLALAKNVVERHGGRIWAEARPEQGCTVRFTLPVKTV